MSREQTVAETPVEQAPEVFQTRMPDSKRTALLRYMIIMFAVAFVLVLMSMVLQTRSSNSTISELHQSSTSALTKAKQLQDTNRDLQDQLRRLDKEMSNLNDKMSAVSGELSAAKAELETVNNDLNTTKAQLDAAAAMNVADYGVMPEMAAEAAPLEVTGFDPQSGLRRAVPEVKDVKLPDIQFDSDGIPVWDPNHTGY